MLGRASKSNFSQQFEGYRHSARETATFPQAFPGFRKWLASLNDGVAIAGQGSTDLEAGLRASFEFGASALPVPQPSTLNPQPSTPLMPSWAVGSAGLSPELPAAITRTPPGPGSSPSWRPITDWPGWSIPTTTSGRASSAEAAAKPMLRFVYLEPTEECPHYLRI